MKFARGLLIFSYGLFTIGAQTLLFREFITACEGNDISVGIFFGSWFLWIGLGALVASKAKAFAEKLLRNVELLFLMFLPAFILQLILIIQARELAGIESYALMPIRTILFLSIIVNAPVSVITGILFPVACRWVQQDQKLPVSSVYILEAAGSFFGGLGVTILLGSGATLAKVFFILAFLVSLSVLFVRLAGCFAKGPTSQKRSGAAGLVPFALITCVLLCLVTGADKALTVRMHLPKWPGADKALMNYLRTIKWTKLLPKDALAGSFQTAQAEYLYGLYQGQWVAIREGSTYETLPDHESSGRIAAVLLCQNPTARKVLVIGSGLGLCYEFLRTPQIEHVTWAHCDSRYLRKVDEFIPDKFKITDERFSRLAGDVRLLLTEKRHDYDLVILNLGDATSSVLNRYYTLEFYRQIKESLTPDGVLGVRVAGGENIMGTELINLGASVKLTLEKVFSRFVLTPGEDTWFIASDSENLTGDPGTLRDRFASIAGAADIFDPQALLSTYLPSRADAAMKAYLSADLPKNLLINRDARPLTHLYSLLLAAKQSGTPVTRLIKLLALAGPLAFLVPILVFTVLRAAYIFKSASQGSKSGFESTFLVFSAGWVGIGVVIVLMYLYQTRFGSLYLHIGVISSLFMVGLTAGAALIRRSLAPAGEPQAIKVRTAALLFVVILVHALILATIAFRLTEPQPLAPHTLQNASAGVSFAIPGVSALGPTHVIFALAFVLCGLCTGCYFPLAANQLADSGFETGQAGSKLEMADHIGASAGGLLASLILVPVLGAKLTLFMFILLMLANVPSAALRIYKAEKIGSITSPARAASRLRALGYVLFGIGVSVVLCSNLLAGAAARLSPSLPQYAAQALAGQSQLQKASAVAGDSAVNYFEVYQTRQIEPKQSSLPAETGELTQELTGYIFSSEDLAPNVRGFGGKMNLAIHVDTSGKLINFHILHSNETPAYLELLGQWQDLLKGHQLFQPQPFADVDTVTGATVSSEAILSALAASGQEFAAEILGQTLQPRTKQTTHRAGHFADNYTIYLIAAFALALLVTYRGGFWTRLAVLLLNLVLGGILLNAQYSSEQIATLLSFQTPPVGLSGAFLLVIGVPLLVIIFGNYYCGYLCPFGAAQELLGYIIPQRFKRPPSIETVRNAAFVKYVVLFVLLLAFFLSRNRTTLASDPLIEVFSARRQGLWLGILSGRTLRSSALVIVAVALIGSFFYTRFWCRYLCPAGAFLSLLNGLAILKRYLPAKKSSRCEFGLAAKEQLDCICCDKCRYESRPITKEEHAPRIRPAPGTLLSRYFVVGVLAVAILVSSVSVNRFLQVIPAGFGQVPAIAASGGQPRDIDLQRIRTMIREKKLSDQEAQFYKNVEQSP